MRWPARPEACGPVRCRSGLPARGRKKEVLPRGLLFQLALSPAGENRLSFAGASKLAPGTKAVALVRLPDGRSATLRFELK